MEGNRLSGTLPALSGLAALEYFNASGNALNGAFPPLAGLANLRGFFVQNNALSGAIAPLSGLENLQSFYVFGNQLSGPVPAPAPPRLAAGDSRLCPNLLDRIDNAGWDAATGVTPWWSDCTVNPDLKVSGTLESKTLQQLEAPPGAQDYAWIVDGDGSFDRSGTQANLQVRYPTEFDGSLSVRSRASSGATTTTSIAAADRGATTGGVRGTARRDLRQRRRRAAAGRALQRALGLHQPGRRGPARRLRDVRGAGTAGRRRCGRGWLRRA